MESVPADFGETVVPLAPPSVAKVDARGSRDVSVPGW